MMPSELCKTCKKYLGCKYAKYVEIKECDKYDTMFVAQWRIEKNG